MQGDLLVQLNEVLRRVILNCVRWFCFPGRTLESNPTDSTRYTLSLRTWATQTNLLWIPFEFEVGRRDAKQVKILPAGLVSRFA